MGMKPRKPRKPAKPVETDTPAKRLRTLQESDDYGFFEDDDCTIW